MSVDDRLAQIWQTVLSQLQMQMTQATFDQWVKDTTLIEVENDIYRLAVKNRFAQEWLDNRLRQIITRTLSQVVDQAVELEFVVQLEEDYHPPPATEPPVASVSSGPTPGEIVAGSDYYRAFFRPGGSGYAMVSHYATMFWQPYLDKAYLLWKRLDTDARDSIKDIRSRWSEPRLYSYTQLMNALNLSHIRYIAGGIMECWRSLEAIRYTDAPLPECCGRDTEVRTRYDRQDRPRCMHWFVGMLEHLYEEGLVMVELSPGDHPRSHTLRLQVWRLLPLLTPIQVNRLNPDLQADHERWLRDFGRLVNVERVADWEQISEPSLVPLLAGYRKYCQIEPGRYDPRYRFRQLLTGFNGQEA